MVSNENLLLKLPPEIRNYIYEKVLTVKNHDRRIDFGCRSKTGNNLRTYSVQSLLLTCSQIYNEACGVFYSVNTVSISIYRFGGFVKTGTVYVSVTLSHKLNHPPSSHSHSHSLLENFSLRTGGTRPILWD